MTLYEILKHPSQQPAIEYNVSQHYCNILKNECVVSQASQAYFVYSFVKVKRSLQGPHVDKVEAAAESINHTKDSSTGLTLAAGNAPSPNSSSFRSETITCVMASFFDPPAAKKKTFFALFRTG